MSEAALKVDERVEIPGDELWFVASRAGGPGGQHVNKTSSRVTLLWDVERSRALDPVQRARVLRRLQGRISRDGILRVSADDERSQHRNRESARERLGALVAWALARRKRRLPTGPTRAARERRCDEKRRRGTIKRLRKISGHDD
ncbi:MAG TPA: alternative ribosome rescue aminoacyl-tRNA hydrolase ArfB [Phycisphaerae bacterium]|nr:alternative ribosome rescue aminoacyl-tRNA hydrolase ArfB [Phycisphaerae bacterium]